MTAGLASILLNIGLIVHFIHVGEHKRLGALDVCPFIPVQGVTMDDCVKCAKMFGERAAAELGIPGEYNSFHTNTYLRFS